MSRTDVIKSLDTEDIAYAMDHFFGTCPWCRVFDGMTQEECEVTDCVKCIIEWLKEDIT